MPYHVLPHLAIEGDTGEWIGVFELLVIRGLSRADALKQIAFAYSGNPYGALPEEMDNVISGPERSDRSTSERLHDAEGLDTWLGR
jgi:hypothetical protein